MSEVKMFYREIAAPPDLTDAVFSFWEFIAVGDADKRATHEVFPDGCVSIFYYRSERRGERDLLVGGLSLETARVSVAGGDVYWAMRLSPAVCLQFLGIENLIAAAMPLRFLPGWNELSAKLTEQLNDCGDFKSAVAVFEIFVRRHRVMADAKIAAAVSFIKANQAQVKMTEVAAAVNLSVRQLERRFRRASGIAPKQYVRARRIRAAAVDLVENRNANWANRAAEMGFADQAHLAHELTNVTGGSPAEFARKISRIEHGEIVR